MADLGTKTHPREKFCERMRLNCLEVCDFDAIEETTANAATRATPEASTPPRCTRQS